MKKMELFLDDCSDNTVLVISNAAEEFADKAANSANLAAEQANRAQEIVDNSITNIEIIKNQAIEIAKSSIKEYQTSAIENLGSEANSLQSDITNSMLAILDTTKKQAELAKYYAEQEHGQSDVTQNDLWNLEAKSLLPTFEIRDETNILNKLKTMKRSTFDKSKFEVIGSPTITDDGVASGFSSGNYLKASNFDRTKPFDIRMKLTTPPNRTAIYPFLAGGETGVNGGFSFELNTSGKLRIFLSSGSGWDIAYGATGTTTLNTSTSYYFRFKWTGTNYYVYTSTDSTNWIQEWTTASTSVLANTVGQLINLGASTIADNFWIGGSIDLKQFSITVDGKEVFSGNKTGLDVIKPDNYTVVGSPTISADGVASGFSSANRLTISKSGHAISKNSGIEIHYSFKTPATSADEIRFIWGKNYNLSSSYASNNVVYVYFLGSTIATPVLQNDTLYDIIFKVKNETLYLKYKKRTETSYIDRTPISCSTATATNDLLSILIGTNGNDTSKYFTGSIDLNAFKIYVDGNLVYQPCLKIPYTQAKLNHKIVDAVYRDRVQDLFEQVGYNGYFTLGENDFTLPTHKFSDVIDCYENGIYKWEQRVDRTLRQQGSCTADEEVTLLKPYKDTNYVLNVPYASKTETGFIPTISGDWVANGKVYLE